MLVWRGAFGSGLKNPSSHRALLRGWGSGKNDTIVREAQYKCERARLQGKTRQKQVSVVQVNYLFDNGLTGSDQIYEEMFNRA